MKEHSNGQSLAWAKRFRQALSLLALLGVLTATIGGCTRAFYRNATDKEVNDILAEKNLYEPWRIGHYHVYPDARARFGDSTNPDRPPMPPDDPTTWKNSPHPQQPGHPGVANVQGTAYMEMIKAWDAESRAEREAIEAEEIKAAGAPDKERRVVQNYFDEPLNADLRGFVLKLEQAVELGVINAREYQSFREELYEAALPVTQERFSFAYQWAALSDFIRQWAGPQSAVGTQNNWTGQSSLGFSKLFSTGALLTLNFANTTVFNFTGAQGLASSSTVNLNVVQPFLQGGGKAVTLEPLTQAERNLFYSIRSYARFRKQFYVAVALGATLPSNLATAAGATNVTNPISVLQALGIASTDVSGGFVGYLSTLYRECDMAVDKKWVHDLERALKIYRGYEEGGIFSPLQVDQVRSTLIQAQNGVLTDQQNVTNAVDQFKLVLGLPANLPLILDDTPSREITRQYDRYYAIIADMDAANELVQKQEQAPPDKMRGFLRQMYATNALVRGTQFQKKISDAWDRWAVLKGNEFKARLNKLDEDLRMVLKAKTNLEAEGKTLSAELQRNMREINFESDLGGLEEQLRIYENKSWEKIPKDEAVRRERTRLFLFRLVSLSAKNVLVWARNERFESTYDKWPAMPAAPLEEEQMDLLTADVNQAQEAAVKVSLANRVDLMNARAQVVDAWRQLKVTANALLGVFNVQYNLQSQTPPNGVKPLAFSASSTNSQLSIEWALPLNRVAQRNAYRSALINYQVARRSLMALEDNIAVQVRFDVRQLQLFAANYRNQKNVIQSFYKQVESALELIVAPADPDQLKASSTAGAATGAALTNQYLGALSGLNGAQTKMYDIWLSLLATRMQLYLDLERMPLDNRGVWIDPLGPPSAQGAGGLMGPQMLNVPPGALLPINLGETVPMQPVSVPTQPANGDMLRPASLRAPIELPSTANPYDE